ncbi:CDP-diacylglycerol--glycerol-3-phosphate 3-phosphatidyltransferase [Amphritea pacifica]|uniref:CDP-diacylglycerol--glycerol-3-phosphate 3-phosphatidyltransferase n=1 Tax=Amphritea pacifica TaxID=2811233 RepID=A0ABS2W8N2_9GAMM|nr:CDP-diacylglycerol--glycerol-3-phosphate 3-phosphatidyltransferase [Amphritea pacifica]MBN0987951.1 CDP-diacylglycerol--glycerol-3-phosphate 3-phosphatidyltransferase [Amphritea pacifica]MBN1005465.1 CDP-diacylglycerol--glycerol-3-phosphate 3-phosphatidyltransferase [Amphritea pacifica]
MKIPNILTLLRIVLIPVFVLVYYLPYAWGPMAAALVFALAAVTDWFDGYLARRLDQTSPFGAFLDPVADKLMVATALVLLVDTYSVFWITAPAIVIIGREIVISALREWMAELGKRANIAVSYIGKLKTALQMLSIFIMLAFVPYSLFSWIGIGALYIASVLTLWSMYVYLKAAWPDLTDDI